MCIKCEIKNIALLLTGKEERLTEIGKVSADAILELNLAEKDVKKNLGIAEAEAKLLVAQGVNEDDAIAQTAAKYQAAHEEAVKKHKGSWNKIYQQLGVEEDPSKTYRINKKTGIVNLVEIVDIEPVAQGAN